MLKPAVVDDHFITGAKFFECFYKPVGANPGTHQVDDLVVNRSRRVVETHHAVHSSCVAHCVVLLVESESSEDVTGKQRPRRLRQLAREFVGLVSPQPRTEGFDSPNVQVATGAILLFGMSMNYKPAKTVSVCVCHI